MSNLNQNPEQIVRERRAREKAERDAMLETKRLNRLKAKKLTGEKRISNKTIKELDEDVITKTKMRYREILRDESIKFTYVSVSGGKDSIAMLELMLDVLREPEFEGRKVGVLHQDFEAIYRDSEDVIERIYNRDKDKIEMYWVALPMQCNCGVSMDGDTWVPWDEAAKHLWVRKRPDFAMKLEDHDMGKFYQENMHEKHFQKAFHKYMVDKKGGRVCSLVGVRADESLIRRILCMKEPVYSDIPGPAQPKDKNRLVLYPIYDWKVRDIWKATAEFGWDYNKIYDLFYIAGIKPGAMRLANPFHESGMDNLKYYKSLEPQTWGKMLGRVNGVKFAGTYGGSRLTNASKVQRPEGKTWKEFADLLFNTIQERDNKLAVGYKLHRAERFWKTIGCRIAARTKVELELAHPEEFESGNFRLEENKDGTYQLYIQEYIDEPKNKKTSLLPSWKVICICLLKNDYYLKYSGFSATFLEDRVKREAKKNYEGLAQTHGGI